MGLGNVAKYVWTGVEKRAAKFAGVSLNDPAWSSVFGYGPTASGATVNATGPLEDDSSMRLSVVWACVRVLSDGVAGVPLILYRRTPDGGRERATDHPLYRLLHDSPNEYQTPYEFRSLEMTSLLLRGNSYARLAITGNGVESLHWQMPDRVRPFRNRRDGRIYYEVIDESGAVTVLSEDMMLHVRGLSGDGVVGYNPIQVARENVGLAITQEEFGARLFRNNAVADKAFHTERPLNKDQVDELTRQIHAKHSGDNSGRPFILHSGLDVKNLTINAADAQFIESRKFQDLELCRIMGVKPHKVGILDRATWGNIESQNIEWVQDGILPWCQRLEQRYNKMLLTREQQRTLFFEHDLNGLLRGDSASRANFYREMVGNGIMTRAEARQRENLPPKEGADELTVQLNQTLLSELERVAKTSTEEN